METQSIFINAVVELKNAAEPFTSGDIVTELTGTIPLMERLKEAIEEIDKLITEV